MEQQPPEFYQRVREGYGQLAAHEPGRIVLIDGSRDAEEIEKNIWEALCSRFPLLTETSNVGHRRSNG